MAFSYQNYTGDNATTTFSIPFTYTDTSEISVTVDGVAETGLTFPSASQVALTSAPASGTLVQVRRTTSLATRAVDFASGSVLTEEDLDNSNIQVFHAAQETTDIATDSIFLGADDKWDAKSKVIKNVATPVATADAANKAYVDQIEADALVAQAAAEAAQAAAETAETNAASSAATATTKASEASTSATNSAASAVASANSSTNSATSATASANSASAAAASEAAASVSEANAGTSETNASTSETNAASSASSASTSATTATTQAGISTAQAVIATTQATNSSNSATASANSATASANSATASANSATAAASSASSAATSETNAANSAAAAAAAFDNFDDTYLGSFASDPTVDNDGDPLTQGDLYFNNSANEMRVYDGANWIAASSAGAASLILYEYTATSGQTTFSGADDNAATLSYSVGNIQVIMNGVVLDPSDFTATSGTSIVLATGATTGDLVNIYAFKSFTVADTVSASAGGTFAANVTVTGTVTADGLTVDTDTLHVDATNNRVGIGVSSPNAPLHVQANSTAEFSLWGGGGSFGRSKFNIQSVDDGSSTGKFQITTESTVPSSPELLTITNAGNVLVGKTSPNIATVGHELNGNGGYASHTRSGNTCLFLNRTTSDGDIAVFRKDGSTVGSIGTTTSDLTIFSTASGHGGLRFSDTGFIPTNNAGTASDNTYDVGSSFIRFDDIYATNGTIQTSDQNEKQQIASLTAAEITAAKAISTLFKTFKWNDSVAEKGDAARTHTGVIAQEVQTAMTDAGLDAGDYAFFISSTWWETQTDVPAVEAVAEVLDDDGNVVTESIEAVDAYTRTDTYETAEEAPEGATERTRMGIRYPELLVFVGAATEQRLADIETRLTALEAV